MRSAIRFVGSKQPKSAPAALGCGAAVLVLAAALPLSAQQLTAPRYQSPIDAPVPQFKLPVPPAITTNGTVVEDVIVRVNDQIIDRSDVEREEQQLEEALQQGKMTRPEFEEAQKNMLRDMIDQQLLLSRGKELDLNVDSDVVRELDEIRKQYKMDSMDALEKAVRDSGISYEDFKANIKNKLIPQMVIRDEVSRNMHRPTTKEEQAYYDAHKQEFLQPEQVQLSEILIPTPENATDAQVAEAQAKADAIETKLKAGANFEDLAKQDSGGPNADKGGDLGLFERGKMGKVLDDQTFPLAAGQFTAPIRTRQGYVVLKVTKHIPAGAPPLKDVEEQVQEAMYNEEMQPAIRKYLTGLREKAYIDIAPGFVDSGASPKETKPVFSAYTPPVPKKKTTAQKSRLGPAGARTDSNVAGTARAQGPAPAGGSAAASVPAAGGASAATPSAKVTATPVRLRNGKKKKVRREKIRFGQAPRNTLPAAPEETLASGSDQGAGATSNVLPAPGAVMAPVSGTADVAANVDPLGPQVAQHGKTRYSDRAATESAAKAAEKAAKIKEKAAAAPPPMTSDEKAAVTTQDSPLGLSGDTAAKKKKKRDKNAPKERLQDQPPAPPAAKPEATPIPPKSVRDNGEPVVSPTPSTAPSADRTTLPPANTPAPGSPVDMQPSTPANATPAPPPSPQPPQ